MNKPQRFVDMQFGVELTILEQDDLGVKVEYADGSEAMIPCGEWDRLRRENKMKEIVRCKEWPDE